MTNLSKNILAGSARHLETLGGIKDFDYLLYNFPFNCRLNCGICCNKERKTKLPSGETLSKEELGAVIKESSRLGARVFGSMGLGEPLISQDFDFLVETAHNNGMIPYMFTTALDLNEERANFLSKNGASLIIHLDSLQNQVYAALYKGQANLGTVLANVERARNLFNTEDRRVSRLALNMVVRKQNIGEVKDISDFCKEDIVFVTNTLIDRNDPDYISDREIFDSTGIRTVPLGTTNDLCEYLNRGISIQGRNVLVCPYSDIRVGKIESVSDVANQIEKAKEFVRKFYEENGKSRCFVRHPGKSDYEI